MARTPLGGSPRDGAAGPGRSKTPQRRRSRACSTAPAALTPPWGTLLAFCAVIAIASVVLTVLYGQTRILFAMSRDGLVPKVFSRVHPRSGAPRANTVIVSLFCGVLAAAVPLGQLADATSIGTLFAFALVNVAVVVLRRTRPTMHRTFRVPLSPLLPAVGFAFCVWMTGSLSAVTWVVFGVWMAVGLVFYFVYGYRRSRLAAEPSPATAKK